MKMFNSKFSIPILAYNHISWIISLRMDYESIPLRGIKDDFANLNDRIKNVKWYFGFYFYSICIFMCYSWCQANAVSKKWSVELRRMPHRVDYRRLYVFRCLCLSTQICFFGLINFFSKWIVEYDIHSLD